jgi:ABC-type bacteriocin/lantibiotic exporter with double-glycine peptidase domain
MKRTSIIKIILYIVLLQTVTLSYPLLTGLLIDQLIKKDWNLYIYCLIAVLFVPFIQGIFDWRKARELVIWSEKSAAHLRYNLLNRLFCAPLHYFSSAKTGEIITRCTDDVKQFVENHKIKFLAFEKGLVLIIIGTALGFKNIAFMVIVLLCGLLYTIQSQKISPWITKIYKQSIKTREMFNEFIRERIQILHLTRLSGCLKWECTKLNKILNEESIIEKKGVTLNFINELIAAFIRSVITGILYLYAGWLLVNNRISLGDLIAALAYYFPLIEAFNSFNTFVQTYRRYQVSKVRIGEIQNIENDDFQKGQAHIPSVEKISFKKISFSYPNRSLVLDDISFTLHKGTVTALVGVSGGGKTTLCELLLKLYKPDSGKIVINDCGDLADLDGGLWRKTINYTPQNTFFFSDTLSANLLYGRDTDSSERMLELTKRLELNNIITNREGGYYMQVSNDFTAFSGGQKQRLSLVRSMILKRPNIFILDEPTSALDYILEKAVMKLIYEYKEDTAIFIIAHRLSTIINADLILVLKDGMIVEQGRHEELLKQEGEYYNLYKHELLGKEEAENII